MKNNKIPKLHLLSSSDSLRPQLSGVYIDGNHAVATDGHVIACIDMTVLGLSVNGLDRCIIPADAWKVFSGNHLTASMSRDGDYVQVETTKKGQGVSVYRARLVNETFPNYRAIIPRNSNADTNYGVDCVTINPLFFARLNDAMPCDVKSIDIKNTTKDGAIMATLRVVTNDSAWDSRYENIGWALIMPISDGKRVDRADPSGFINKFINETKQMKEAV